jgi:hypothetical protein
MEPDNLGSIKPEIEERLRRKISHVMRMEQVVRACLLE